ncbi:MAG: outer membrane protein assembly factor, partial [Flammeovirgaceae bacterium]|nr:outer membrane protein assembly factor [Flammeovirgaceae bacterium]MDW8288959.1 BamA/TamA family outer membrane protein [Flammeovirgaceae bacterium]
LFPHKGWQVSFLGLTGQKNISYAPNDTLFSQIPPSTRQWQLATEVASYWHVSKNTSLMYRGKGMKIWNDYLFINELERLGGLQTMRGFNERSFFVSAFWLNTLSYRLHLEQQNTEESMLFIFVDQAWTEKTLWRATPLTQRLWAIGAGLQIQTNVGIFQFVYALGKIARQPFALNQAKIHFGLMSRF